MRVRMILAVVVGLALIGSARADGIDDLVDGMRAQQQGDHAQAILLLTRAVNSRNLTPEERVSALVKRGNSYYARGQVDRALNDYNDVLKARPGLVEARLNRGVIRFKRGDVAGAVGDYDVAIAAEPNRVDLLNNRAVALARLGRYADAIGDYDHALKIAPDYLTGLRGRARAYFYQGDFAAAAADYRRVLALGPARLYTRLWFYIALARSGQDGRAAFGGVSSAGIEAWPGPIARLYLGKTTPARVLKGLGQGSRIGDTRPHLEKACEAYFFLGQYALINGDRNQARAYLRKAVATDITYFVEYMAAKVELERLGS